jgi:hypothetical protein
VLHDDAFEPDDGQDWGTAATLPVEAVRELFVTMGKALRAYQLYDENNPVYQRFVTSLSDAFARVWAEVASIWIMVEEDRFVLEEVSVYQSESRSDSLAFLFYKDGVRALEFRRGIENEVEAFLGVLQRARQGKGDGDDLITLLWDADLQHMEHRYVDLLAEGIDVPDPGGGASEVELRRVLDEETGPEEEEPAAAGDPAQPPPPSSVSQDDFNPTLYALDAREMEALRGEVEREMRRDVRADVAAALLDRLEEPEYPDRQREILSIFRALLPSLLSRGALDAAGAILRELRAMERRDDLLGGEHRAFLRTLLDELSAESTMVELVRALEDGTLTPTPEELGGFLLHLRGAALGPLLRASELTDRRELQPVIRGAVQGIAAANPRALAQLLAYRDPIVQAGAARLVGRMKVTEASGAVANLLTHDDPRVRLAAVEASRDLRAATSAGALLHRLDDPEREIRIAAARALGTLGYRPAAERFKDFLDSKELRLADLSEKIAFFESYAELGDPNAEAVLSKILNGRGFLGRRESPEMRACAALGLGRLGSPGASEALRRALDEEDPVVRSAVGRALRGGGDEA